MSDQSGGYSAVGQPPNTPGLPQNPLPIVFSGFSGLNTKASQQGIQDQEMYVCDGYMPLGPNNLRTLYGIDDVIYTAPGSATIKSFSFNNIGSTSYIMVSLSDGAIDAVDISTGIVTHVAAANTITEFLVDFSQWAGQYIIFVAPQTNGYFLWDGNSIFKSGTLSPNVTIINGGSGYTGAPTITTLSAGAVASGGIVFNADPGPGNTVTLNGVVWTFVASGAVGNQVNISGIASLTILNLINATNASSDPLMTVATYGGFGGPVPVTFTVTYDTSGAIGNAYTLASSTGSAVPSGPTLSGGVDGGAGATFTGTVENGSLVSVTVTDPGSGYVLTDLPILTITGGGSDDMASATAIVNTTGSGVASVIVNNGGKGYSSLVAVAAASAAATEPALFSVVGQNGVITEVIVTNPGLGYTSPPALTVLDLASGAVGTGAILTAVIQNGQIAGVTLDTPGSGYTSPPTLTIIGDGTGAVLNATLTGSLVDSIQVVNPGVGYTRAAIQFNGGNRGAAATVSLMPFGVSGTTVETYQSRVWIGNGRVGQVSSPGDPTNFVSADGATSFKSTDSFLRQEYTKFIQSNGFLYLFGDSSINYISGVSTAGNPALTTFSNLNVDPQIGTPWPSTVQLFGRDIIFANSVGVFVSYGGAVTKVSDALDGIYTTVPESDWPDDFVPSAAVMTIFGIRCYILALPVVDQVTGDQVIKCLMWDGKKWWTAPQQGFTNPFLASQDFNSVLSAYATINHTSIAKLFTNPTQNLTKYVYSKLWDNPGIFVTKMQRQLYGVLNVNDLDAASTASGNIFFPENPSPGDTMTLNSVAWLFVASGATGTQINISGNTALTLLNMISRTNASVDPLMTVATYSGSGGPDAVTFIITYDTTGATGNNYTLAASAATPSGPTLTGGTNGAEIFVAPITENGVGSEQTINVTKVGPVVFGPIPSVEPGGLMGVRVRTAMSDVQINQVTLINQLEQSKV